MSIILAYLLGDQMSHVGGLIVLGSLSLLGLMGVCSHSKERRQYEETVRKALEHNARRAAEGDDDPRGYAPIPIWK